MDKKPIEQCIEISTNPYDYLKKWKIDNNKKIISCFAMHIPEEIVFASGMLPVISWRSDESVTMGHSHVATFNCGLTRSFIDDLVKEKLDFIDGIVVNRMCLQAQGLPFLLEQASKVPYIEYLSLPALYDDNVSYNYLLEEFKRFKTGLEKVSGNTITDDTLNNAIDIYNKNRKLLSEIYGLRRKNPGIIKGKEMLAVVHSSMLMSKDINNTLLEKVVEELNNRKQTLLKDERIKVITYGGLCQTVNTEILTIIEDLGMVIVDDDIFVGSKYFANPVEKNGNPYEALANRYMKKTPPCPTKGDYRTDWTDYIIEMAEKNNAKGIISLMIKYCPPHMCYYPDIKNKLAAKGIPEILIEVEHEIISFEQVKTRLQTFVEILQGV